MENSVPVAHVYIQVTVGEMYAVDVHVGAPVVLCVVCSSLCGGGGAAHFSSLACITVPVRKRSDDGGRRREAIHRPCGGPARYASVVYVLAWCAGERIQYVPCTRLVRRGLRHAWADHSRVCRLCRWLQAFVTPCVALAALLMQVSTHPGSEWRHGVATVGGLVGKTNSPLNSGVDISCVEI